MNDQNQEQNVIRLAVSSEKEEIAWLRAEVIRLRMFIQTYTAIECRGQTFYPEWAERALRE